MAKIQTLIVLLLLASQSIGQITLFSDDLESGAGSWTFTGDLLPNFWIGNSCAGNGISSPGVNAMYITPGGSVAGCGATGTEQYAYENSPFGSLSAISYVTIDGGCVTTMQIAFDYRIEGVALEDFAELVYSDDNGASWNAIGASLPVSAAWTTTTIALPAILDGTIFDLGFRFSYNDTGINGSPLAVDNITVQGNDVEAPTINCPLAIPLYVNASCEETLIDYTSLAFTVDNCNGSVTVTQSPLPGTLVDISSTPLIILTATDATGNQNQCQFTQTIFDTISPAITCPGNQSLFLDAACSGTVGDFTTMGITADNCVSFASVTVTQSPPPGSIIGADATITLTAEDGYSNTSSCIFTLLTFDTISPTVVCPASTTVSTNSGCDYSLANFMGASVGDDNCTSAVSLIYSQSPVVGTLIPLGIQPVTITVEDASGNTGLCVFNLTVEDQVNPTITLCAPNQNVIVDTNCQGILGDYTSLISATDNCSLTGNLTITQLPISGTTISSDTLIVMTVTDEAGNSSNCQFTALLSDTISPVVTCPNDFSLAINPSCEYTMVDVTSMVSGSDNCSAFGDMTLTQSPVAGSTQTGITNVLITLFDEQGNINTCITSITPIDTTPPTVTCPSPAPVNIGTSCNYSLPNYGSSALILDNCPNYIISQSPAVGTNLNPGTTTITIYVTDAGGNTAECSFPLTVIENESPVITCPANISTCDPVVTYSDPVFSDNCFAYLTQTDATGLSSDSTFPVGITTLEYTAADSSGNSQSCSFTVEVLDFPSSANITDDTLSACGILSVILDADSTTSGSGLWTVISGSGDFNNQFSNTTGVNNLDYGTNIFAWTVSSASCGSLSDTVVVIATQAPSQANISQDTLLSCAISLIDLAASTPLVGNGVWTTNSSATVVNPNSNITNGQVYESGWSQFIWTVSNGSCPTTADTLYVFSSLTPTISIPDTSLCQGDGTFFLEGSLPIAGQNPEWYVMSGQGILSTPQNFSTEVTNLSFGINKFRYSMKSEGCPDAFSTVLIDVVLCDGFDPVFPNLMTPNYDGKNDLFVINGLEKIYPECHVLIFNRWGSIVFESTGYADPWDGTYKGEDLPMGTYFYKIELNDDSGTVYNGDISIIH